MYDVKYKKNGIQLYYYIVHLASTSYILVLFSGDKGIPYNIYEFLITKFSLI